MNFKLGAGLVLLTTFLLLALGAASLSPAPPNEMNLSERYLGPSFTHPLGQDENGSDVLAKVLFGARVSLLVAASVVSLCLILGLVTGSIAGILGGWSDRIIMRLVELVHAFPSFLLALAILAMRGPSLVNLIAALTVSGWTGYARLVRSEVLRLREDDFVQAATALGASRLRIVIVHLWPNLLGLLSIQATAHAAGTVIAEAGLTFLGLGLPADVSTWGSLIASGRQFLSECPHVAISAGLSVVLLATGFSALGDGLKQRFAPERAAQ